MTREQHEIPRGGRPLTQRAHRQRLRPQLSRVTCARCRHRRISTTVGLVECGWCDRIISKWTFEDIERRQRACPWHPYDGRGGYMSTPGCWPCTLWFWGADFFDLPSRLALEVVLAAQRDPQ